MACIYIVVPCYNEEEVLPESARLLRMKLQSLIAAGKADASSRLLLVDDGSTDRTWSIIRSLCGENELICGLRLSKNRGHQNALLAGLITAAGHSDASVSIDADLQDDIEAIEPMVDKFNAGTQIVCGVRKNRDSDTLLKRFTAHGFYFLMGIFGSKTIFDHADFRLMSSGALRELCRFGTEELYLRGLIVRLGYPIEKVYYDRMPRTAGESKYSLRKMLALAKMGFESKKMQPASQPVKGELYIAEEIIK